ncbi:response regulator [Chitinophaga silvatica]|nr:response regulator transcription factor [Chitinophaga silvatica]
MNILIADDHAIVRYGLAKIISGIDLAANTILVDSFNAVIQHLDTQQIKMLILDINLPGGNSIQMIDAIKFRQPDTHILIFSAYDERLYALDYLQAGADGYLSKSATEEETKLAIRTLFNGEKYMSAATRQMLLQKLSKHQPKSNSPFDTLSAREVEVMNMLIKGIALNKISELLNLQVSTVSTYKTRIFHKLQVESLIGLLDKIKLYETVIQ